MLYVRHVGEGNNVVMNSDYDTGN